MFYRVIRNTSDSTTYVSSNHFLNGAETTTKTITHCICDDYITVFGYAETDMPDSITPVDEIDEFLFNLYINQNIKNAQWILREGVRMRFDPPKINYIDKPVFFRKKLRCNRKGIGLRIHETS